MSNKDEKYFNFPIQMLKQLHTDLRAFCDNAFDVGVHNKAKTLEGDQRKQTKDALKFLNVTAGDSERSMINGRSISGRYPENSPIVGIGTEMFFDFYKNAKTEFDVSCLAAFLAIRSILGKKPYCKTNKQLIHARMFGYVSTKDVPTKLSPQEAKYKLRWHMDKILIELQLNWHLKLYAGHQRGMCVSFDLELPELVKMVEKSKYINRISEFRKTKQALIAQTTH
jgi:hypothetical protein